MSQFEFTHFLASLSGGGAVLALSWWVFSRLIDQVDKLGDRISLAERDITRLETKMESHLENGLSH